MKMEPESEEAPGGEEEAKEHIARGQVVMGMLKYMPSKLRETLQSSSVKEPANDRPIDKKSAPLSFERVSMNDSEQSP